MAREKRVVEDVIEENYEDGLSVSDEDFEDDNNNTPASSGGNNEESLGYDESTLEQISNKLIRVFFAREFKKSLITRDSMNSVIKEYHLKGAKFNDILNVASRKLKENFGMALIPLPVKAVTSQTQSNKRRILLRAEPKKKKVVAADPSGKIEPEINAKTAFILINILPVKFKKILGEQWNEDSVISVDESRNNEMIFYTKNKKSPAMATNYELILTGITVLIISLIVIAGGHMSEKEMMNQLKQFGFSSNDNIKHESLNMNTKDILKLLDKQEYIIMEGKKTDGTSPLLEFAIGRRSKIELNSLSVFDFIKNIYGLKFDMDIRNRTIVTLSRVFGEFEDPNIDRHLDADDPDDAELPEANLEKRSRTHSIEV